jgi:pimeloyl-ACP methyl ester carboxylesterase
MSDQKKEVALFAGALSVSLTDRGEGRGFLVLHGGAGPASAFGLAEALSKSGRVVAPTHPGFAGEPRPDWFSSIDDLAIAYLALIDNLNLSDVIVVGNSVGGWIAAEMAVRRSPRIVGIVLLNAVGIDTGSPDKKIADPMAVPPADRAALSFHDPKRFAMMPTGPQLAVMAENQRTLRVYAGDRMIDPNLRARLAQISIPAMVLWGESDRIVDADYGRRWAESIPGARFELVGEAGHFPQIERLDEVLRLIGDFATRP